MKEQKKIKIALLLGIMCAFLTAGIFIQIRTVQSSTTTVGRTQAENELRDSVLRWKEQYENAYSKLEKKETELDALREKASNSDETSNELSNKLENYNKLLGYTEVKGEGVIVTLKDGDSSVLKNAGLFLNDLIVHDGDLQQVVNALKNAGAEAISINDERIVNKTSIICAGNVVTINDKKVGAPFVIKAIGPSGLLYYSLKMPGGYIERLEADGINVDVKQVEKETIVIPKYEGVYKLEHASNVE